MHKSQAVFHVLCSLLIFGCVSAQDAAERRARAETATQEESRVQRANQLRERQLASMDSLRSELAARPSTPSEVWWMEAQLVRFQTMAEAADSVAPSLQDSVRDYLRAFYLPRIRAALDRVPAVWVAARHYNHDPSAASWDASGGEPLTSEASGLLASVHEMGSNISDWGKPEDLRRWQPLIAAAERYRSDKLAAGNVTPEYSEQLAGEAAARYLGSIEAEHQRNRESWTSAQRDSIRVEAQKAVKEVFGNQ